MTSTASREQGRGEFPAEAQAVRDARRFVLESEHVARVDRDLLEIAVSELASNAVLHARTPFTVVLDTLDDGIRVAVSDRSVALPRATSASPESVTGRGLMIVESVARSWGTEHTPEGKTVWFEMGWSEP